MKYLKFIFTLAFALTLCGCANNQKQQYSFLSLDTTITITSNHRDFDTLKDEIKTDTILFDEKLSAVCEQQQEYSVNQENINTFNQIIKDVEILNNKYDGKLDLFCGHLTRLWNISCESSKVPTENEIKNYLSEKDYYPTSLDINSDFSIMDFGSVAKGYVCDKIYEKYQSKLNNKYLIFSSNSSSVLFGEKKDNFNIVISEPQKNDEKQYLGKINSAPCFVSTSGSYERYFVIDGKEYSHIFDTSTGYPSSNDLLSVTVIVPITTKNGGLISDALSTMIFLDGSQGLYKYVSDNEEYGIVAIDSNKNVYTYNTDFKFYSDEKSNEYKLCKIQKEN